MNGLRTALRELPDAVFVDVLESDDAYRIVADLPGATADDVDVGVTAGRLTIDAEPASPVDDGDADADESTSGASGAGSASGADGDSDDDAADDSTYSYVRRGRDRRYDVELPLPPDAAGEGATATVERGVLQVTLPKRSVLGTTDVDVEGA